MEVTKHYNDSIELGFNKERHLYTANGIPADGATTILSIINKPALMGWAVKEAVEYLRQELVPGKSYDEIELKNLLKNAKSAYRKKKDTAADIGTMAHEWIESWMKDPSAPPPVNAQIKNCTDAFIGWAKENNVTFVLSEARVYSKLHNFAGTLDFTCDINGKKFLGDIKTSSGIWREYWYQVGGYHLARTEEFPEEKYDGVIIVNIKKDGSFIPAKDVQSSIIIQPYEQAFLHALELYRINKE